ncbi:hypothetical protein HPB51_007216 [Rhipicephalus microplus]|uniref:Uncharacterized protein n=1 Tax=Rhipicephalus microplus TaxID=6941 RepID=A0A9J6E0B9_RHIMP|nr:hypothetical protein HPB51_007216 [Rhipicephalus microplus]
MNKKSREASGARQTGIDSPARINWHLRRLLRRLVRVGIKGHDRERVPNRTTQTKSGRPYERDTPAEAARRTSGLGKAPGKNKRHMAREAKQKHRTSGDLREQEEAPARDATTESCVNASLPRNNGASLLERDNTRVDAFFCDKDKAKTPCERGSTNFRHGRRQLYRGCAPQHETSRPPLKKAECAQLDLGQARGDRAGRVHAE